MKLLLFTFIPFIGATEAFHTRATASLLHGPCFGVGHCVEKAGFPIRFSQNEKHSQFFAQEYQHWETLTFQAFSKLTKPDSIVLDIGGWIGPTALWFAHAAQEVIVMEPTKAAFAELVANIDKNADVRHKIKPLQLAMSDTSSHIAMSNRGDSMDVVDTAATEEQEQTGLVRRRDEFSIESICIEDLVKKYPELERVDLVKMDVEGYEAVVIPAMKDWILKQKPNMFISFHPQSPYSRHDPSRKAALQKAEQILADICPYFQKSALDAEHHGGFDVVCVWEKENAQVPMFFL